MHYKPNIGKPDIIYLLISLFKVYYLNLNPNLNYEIQILYISIYLLFTQYKNKRCDNLCGLLVDCIEN